MYKKVFPPIENSNKMIKITVNAVLFIGGKFKQII
jgi:hypothetical protein